MVADSEIPVLSLWQPWAQLVVAGRKTIETRSWSTKHRGRIAIHAGKTKADYRDPVYRHCSTNGLLDDDIKPLVFGAIVATADLVDCVQTESLWWTTIWPRWAWQGPGGAPCYPPQHEPDVAHLHVVAPVTDQPFGDYTAGRWAWLLADVQPLAVPLPFKGGQGLTRKVSLDAVTA